MKIRKFKHEKVEIESVEWDVPTEPIYLFETGIRRSISIIPKWTTWNKEAYNKEEEIFELGIVCVYQSFEAKIEAFNIPISRIEELYYLKPVYGGEDSIAKLLVDNDGNTRTKEQFDADFENCLNKIKDKL